MKVPLSFCRESPSFPRLNDGQALVAQNNTTTPFSCTSRSGASHPHPRCRSSAIPYALVTRPESLICAIPRFGARLDRRWFSPYSIPRRSLFRRYVRRTTITSPSACSNSTFIASESERRTSETTAEARSVSRTARRPSTRVCSNATLGGLLAPSQGRQHLHRFTRRADRKRVREEFTMSTPSTTASTTGSNLTVPSPHNGAHNRKPRRQPIGDAVR